MQDRYDFKEVEERTGRFWADEKIYAYDPGSKKKVYAIDTPPPTVSGFIHIGHVFSYSQADFIARYKRMQDFNVFYPFGFDNNGLPTELLVEKNHKITAEKLGREKFIELVESETKKYEQIYRETWQKVGISVDWSLVYSTIGKEAQRVSQLSFLKLNKMGRTYRKETPTMWCPSCKTAVSQMELKDRMLKSKFVNIRFADDVIIATTRPELLPACVAVFVNPGNPKTKRLIGKRVKVPLFGQEVEIIADQRVDPEKGTGVVMCCTFGDQTDIEWYKAYSLPLKLIIDERGKIVHGDYKGLKIKEAREKIVEDLKANGSVVGEKELEHSVNVHERCNTEIEFLVKMQWYIRYLDLKDKFLELGKRLKWHPEYMRSRYENWVNGLQWDWAISRQRYYGVPFPVWYCKKCGEPKFAEEGDLPVNPMMTKPKGRCKCSSDQFAAEEDVMDTWATSSTTPLINARWDGEKYDERVYPMALRPQAHDIITFWLFTSVVKANFHTGKLPWSDALISGHALDPKGNPMHKSAGNIIEPKAIMEKSGADPLRYWASLSRLGDDASFQEKDIMAGSKLTVKLWNVAKFIEKLGVETREQPVTNIIDRWMLSRLMTLIGEATQRFDDYDYAGANRVTSEFFWSFTDNYLEFIKYRIYSGDKSANYALTFVFTTLLKMFAPFMPYVTEEIYQQLFAKSEGVKSVHLARWPQYDAKLFDQKSLDLGEKVAKTIVTIRQWKHDNKMALNAPLAQVQVEGLTEGFGDIAGAMAVREVSKGKGSIPVPETEVKLGIKV